MSAGPDRRRTLAGALAAFTAPGLAAPALSQGLVRWRMVTAWPRDLPGAGASAARLAQRIGQLTEGRLTVELFAAGELAPPQAGMAAVMEGRAELAHDLASAYLARSPAFAFFTAVPMGLTAREHQAWLIGGGQALWDELCSPFGIRAFAAGNTGAHLAGWFRREVDEAQGFRGLRIRIAGLGAQVMERLGATVVPLSGAEIVPALQAGTLDAASFLGPLNDVALGLHRAAPVCYWPGFHEPQAVLQLQVGTEAFSGLQPGQRAAIQAAAAEENLRALAEFDIGSRKALAVALGSGARLRQMPTSLVQAIGRAAGVVLADLAAGGDAMTQRVAASYFAARSEALLWTRISDQAFTNLRLLDYGYPGTPPAVGP